jgi:hypothetical protein
MFWGERERRLGALRSPVPLKVMLVGLRKEESGRGSETRQSDSWNELQLSHSAKPHLHFALESLARQLEGKPTQRKANRVLSRTGCIEGCDIGKDVYSLPGERRL